MALRFARLLGLGALAPFVLLASGFVACGTSGISTSEIPEQKIVIRYFTNEEPPLRPLIKVHPATDRKALYIGRHAYGIPGLAATESERLLDELISLACRPPRIHCHD